MLKGLSEFVIRVADLAEAEGQLRTSVTALAVGAALMTIAALVSVLGLALLVYALFQWMADTMGPAPAALVTGLITLGGAAGLGYAGWKSMGAKNDGGPGSNDRKGDR